MAEKPLLDTIVDTSARVGSLMIPAGLLESHLGRFASQLTVWNHDDVYKISIRGSATGLIHAERAILVCSMHQLRGVELSDVCLLRPDGSHVITSSGARTFRPGEHTQESDAFDIAAFEFTAPAAEFPELTKPFFRFDQVPPDTHNVNIMAFVIAGFPSGDQKYELEDRNHLGMVRRILIALPDSQPEDHALMKLKFVQELDFDPDGLSGGPAFVVQLVHGECRVFQGGVVLRAGRSHCYILKSGYLWDFLSAFR